MNAEVIKKLLDSTNLDDNKLGLFLLRDLSINDISKLFERHPQVGDSVHIPTIIKSGVDFNIENKLFVHCNSGHYHIYNYSSSGANYIDI